MHEQNASVPLRLTKELLTERGSTSLASGIRNGRRANICIKFLRLASEGIKFVGLVIKFLGLASKGMEIVGPVTK